MVELNNSRAFLSFFVVIPNRICLLGFVVILTHYHIFGQTYSAIYEFDDDQIYQYTDADVYPLNDGHVMALHMIYRPDSDREFDHLAFHEFDSCGMVSSRVIEIEPLFGISNVSDFLHRGDSLYLIVRGTSTPGVHPYSEGGILTIHRETLKGRYRYYRFTQGALFYNLDMLHDGGFVVSGYSSSTMGQPSRFMSMQLDSEYNIIKSTQFGPSYTVSTDVRVLPDQDFLIRTSTSLFKCDNNYNVKWKFEFDRPTSGERSILMNDGIILPIFGWYGDSELQLIKLDYNGNLLWKSPRLNEQIDYDGNFRLIDAKDGTLLVVAQSYEFDEYEGDIHITRLNYSGEVLDQFAVETANDSTAFEWIREATFANGAVWVMMTNTERKLKLYRIDDEYEICGHTDFNYKNDDDYHWLGTGSSIVFNPLDIMTGQYEVGPKPINIAMNNVCTLDYPLYDLLPTDTLLCDNNILAVNLDTISEPVFWSDGSNEKVRVISMPGTYSYGYGPCQSTYAESITVAYEDCTCRVYIPSAFSPNNDGLNDLFQEYSPCNLKPVSTMKIFDRWGSKVFESQPDQSSWDGTFEGKLLEAGVYVYVFSYEDIRRRGQERAVRTGEVYLVR